MSNEVDKRMKQAAQECADKIKDSAAFMVLFNEHMVEEVLPLIQMGLAVYMDKPIVLLVPESKRGQVSVNLVRMARRIEFYDDALPPALMKSCLEAAVTRLMEVLTDPGSAR